MQGTPPSASSAHLATSTDSDSNRPHSHLPAVRLALIPAESRSDTLESEPKASAPTSMDLRMCINCGRRPISQCTFTDPEWCSPCDISLWSTRLSPVSPAPEGPCVQAAGTVVCVCGHLASEHCPGKENHHPRSHVCNVVCICGYRASKHCPSKDNLPHPSQRSTRRRSLKTVMRSITRCLLTINKHTGTIIAQCHQQRRSTNDE